STVLLLTLPPPPCPTLFPYHDALPISPLYFRTTTEMLQEFAYLGEERARQVVIENTNAIAARCEEMAPLPKGLYAPNLPGAAERSEEHTSELQSRENLVCRLLLEKKKV